MWSAGLFTDSLLADGAVTRRPLHRPGTGNLDNRSPRTRMTEVVVAMVTTVLGQAHTSLALDCLRDQNRVDTNTRITDHADFTTPTLGTSTPSTSWPPRTPRARHTRQH